MERKRLLKMQNVGYYSDDPADWDIHEMNCELFAGERIAIETQNSEQAEVFRRILQKQLSPKAGSWSCIVHVQYDQEIWNRCDHALSLEDNLNSRLFRPVLHWKARYYQRFQLWQVFNFKVYERKTSLSHLSSSQQQKVWQFLLMMAQTELLILNQSLQRAECFPEFQQWMTKKDNLILCNPSPTHLFACQRCYYLKRKKFGTVAE